MLTSGLAIQAADWMFRAEWRLASRLIVWFRPAGRVTFASRGKSNQKRLPLHPALRCAQGSFAQSPLQGSAYKGHPWPFKPLAASMRLALLRNDCAHPSERGGWCRLAGCAKEKAKRSSFRLLGLGSPSKAKWRCCAGGREAWTPSGQGYPFVTAPGARET